MGWFESDSDQARAHSEVSNAGHQSSISHELIAGAAAYEADRAYQKHCEANGKPASHDQAKALLAGFVGAFLDKEVETRGLDFIDKEKAKHDARKQAEHRLQEEYN